MATGGTMKTTSARSVRRGRGTLFSGALLIACLVLAACAARSRAERGLAFTLATDSIRAVDVARAAVREHMRVALGPEPVPAKWLATRLVAFVRDAMGADLTFYFPASDIGGGLRVRVHRDFTTGPIYGIP